MNEESISQDVSNTINQRLNIEHKKYTPETIRDGWVSKDEPWIPEYRYREILFRECQVAGLSFHLEEDDELWDELEVGIELALVRDRHNRYDRNAVALALANDYDGDPGDFDFDFIIGYIPRDVNSDIAALMDAGYADKFSAKISTLRKDGNYNDRIEISIYIQSMNRELVRPDLLRAESISLLELRKLVDELRETGTAYFRWGNYHGFPPDELQTPAKGEKVVLVYRDRDSEILYLMRVFACGKECARYVEDPESIDCIDDCSPFILTNVMGPIRIKKKEWKFLKGVDMKRFSALDYLPFKLSDGFKGIFQNELHQTLQRDNFI